MSWTIKNRLRATLARENSLCQETTGRGGQLSVCLVSPSRYQTGMSSLGFQTVYSLLSRTAGLVCERAFLPDREEVAEYRRSNTPMLSLESQRPLADFDLIAFSTSFEPDYVNIPLILELARIPSWAAQRTVSDPLVVAGGAAFMINPEPAAAFLDLICIGEGELLIPALAAELLSRQPNGRHVMLKNLARLPGFYVPSLFEPLYEDGHFAGFVHPDDVPAIIQRTCANLAEHAPASSVILTDDTEFGDMFLVEVSRGCPRGCRFCTSGFIYGAFRQHPYESILAAVESGLAHRQKIGLVGAAVSDYCDIGRLCSAIVEKGAKVSVSSLRIDRLDPEMVAALVACGHKTISLAPEGGSQRLRDLIRKNLNVEQILSACDMLISRDILNLKLYFIIGLPTESEDDLEELLRLVMAIRERIVARARANRRLGELTLSVNPFIPKPFTPFQWCGMEPLQSLERKVKFLESRLRPVANVHLKVESLKGCQLQALLSRGDRRCAPLLVEMSRGASLKKAAKSCGIDVAQLVSRSLDLDAVQPWEILECADMVHLRSEYQKAFAGRMDQC